MTTTTTTTNPANTSPSAPTRYVRRILAMIVGLLTIVAVPGTALASTEPGRSGSGTTTAVTNAVGSAPAPDAASSGWGLTTVVGIAVVVALVAGILVLAQRVARQRRLSTRPA
ncbi:MAG: hypothetical protein ACHQE5_06205 [Actinomycetes bacterium]